MWYQKNNLRDRGFKNALIKEISDERKLIQNVNDKECECCNYKWDSIRKKKEKSGICSKVFD